MPRLSDRGDQFFVRANTDNPAGTFTFGTAVRNPDGTKNSWSAARTLSAIVLQGALCFPTQPSLSFP